MRINPKTKVNLRRLAIFSPLLIALFLVPGRTYALFDIADITFKAVNTVMFGISWAVSWLGGVFVILEAYILQWILTLSFNIVNTSPIVQFGFPVALSLANLMFVLGLIVIALATILHIESYGLKNILWKLVVVAIAVNFGLIIAGTILNFADNIAMFMVQSINPANGGGAAGFASNLAGAFNPQDSFSFSAEKVSQSDITNFQSAWSATAADAAGFLKPILGTVLSFFGVAIIIIVLGAAIVILLIRYIRLSFDLISLPIAWAAWPFPKFKSQTSKWWSGFLNRAFYPIPLIFFIWLALIMSVEMSKVGDKLKIQNLPNTGNTLGGIVNILGSFLTPFVQQLMRLLLLGGVMIAGLLASEKMGSAFAENTRKAITAGRKKLQGNMAARIGRRAERAGRAVQQATAGPRAGFMQARARLQKFNESFGGLKKDKRVEVALENSGAVKNSKELAKVDAEGYFMDHDGNRLPGGKAVWDGHNQNYRRNADGNFVDSAGNEVLAALVQHANVALDNNRNVVMKNGQVQYLNENNMMAKGSAYQTPDGKWHAYTDANGELMSQVSAYRQSEYTAARAEMTGKGYVKDKEGNYARAEDLRDAMRMQAKESTGLLKSLVAEPIIEAIKKMGAHQSELKEEDLKKFLDERGIKLKGGAAPAAPPPTPAGGGHP